MDNDFPASTFDEWAERYDRSVSIDQYPFLGYREVLACIVELAEPRPGLTVLDLGTGTGNLALLFQQHGCELWCTDFSKLMLEIARRKLPGAHFFHHDLRSPLPPGLGGRFERIVSAYVFHHFPLDEKIRILRTLADLHMAPGGRMVIGDIAFQDQAALEQFKTGAGEEWEDEFYWLADETISALMNIGIGVEYRQVSRCAGVFILTP